MRLLVLCMPVGVTGMIVMSLISAYNRRAAKAMHVLCTFDFSLCTLFVGKSSTM